MAYWIVMLNASGKNHIENDSGTTLCGLQADPSLDRDEMNEDNHKRALTLPMDSITMNFVCKRCVLTYRKLESGSV